MSRQQRPEVRETGPKGDTHLGRKLPTTSPFNLPFPTAKERGKGRFQMMALIVC